jgi:predicted MFS family arabinose efflux permease
VTRDEGTARAVRLLQVTAFVSTFDRFAMAPMVVAISRELDVSPSSVLTAASAYFLVYGLMQPVWGMVSDWLGRVRTMRLTLLLAGLATISSAFAGSVVGLGVTRGVAGAFFGAAYPASLIYIGDTVPMERRQPEVTRLMVGVALGTAAASVGAGVVAELLSWRVAFVVTGVAALVLVPVLRRLPEPDREVVPGRTPLAPLLVVLRTPTAVLVLTLGFLEGAVLLGVLTLLPTAVHDAGYSESASGAVTAAYGVAVFGWATLVGRLSGRFHPSRLIALGGAAALAACLVLTVSQEAGAALVVTVLVGFAWTFMHSSLQTWATGVVPHARAAVMSLFAAALFIGSAVATAATADLAAAQDYSRVFGLAALVAVPLGVIATVGRARWSEPSSSRARSTTPSPRPEGPRIT